MKRLCPLASGSKGNSIFIETGESKLLIDAGLSLPQLKKRLAAIDVDVGEIDAIVVTHEHTDHIRGLDKLAEKVGTPIFANSDTAKAIAANMKSRPRFKIFSTGETFSFGDVDIHPFSVQHDTLDPVGFTLECEGIKVGICADLGFVTTLVRSHLQGCDYLYLESNHDPSMVYACSRPVVYKQRVLGRQGHISNEEASSLLASIYHDGLKHVYLAHLSEECNNPELALKTAHDRLSSIGATVPISIAYQEKVSEALVIEGS